MCLLPDELCDCSSSDDEAQIIENEKDSKCSFCTKCVFPDYMLDIISFDGKDYKVCDSKKVSLYNKLINDKKINGSNNLITNNNNDVYINDDIFNIEDDIFKYEIFTDYYIITEYNKSIKLDKISGCNSNKHYIDFIKSLPWTYKLDKILDSYTSCSELMENHFRKKPDKPSITFGNLPIKYNKFYYMYVLYTSEQCIECQKNEEGCIIYNKLINFIKKKLYNKKNNTNVNLYY